MTTFEAWSVTIAVVASCTNIVVFAALVWQLQILRRQVRQAQRSNHLDHDRRRKQATIEFYATTLAQQQQMREILPHDRDEANLQATIARAMSGDEQANKAIAGYLSLHNLIAVSVRSDVFDIAVIDQVFGGRLLALEENYRRWIEHNRRSLGYPTMFADIEWLAGEIAARRGLVRQRSRSTQPDDPLITAA